MAERLRGLGLTAMADAFIDLRNHSAADDLSREDWLGLLIDREVTARDNKRLGRRLSLAGDAVLTADAPRDRRADRRQQLPATRQEEGRHRAKACPSVIVTGIGAERSTDPGRSLNPPQRTGQTHDPAVGRQPQARRLRRRAARLRGLTSAPNSGARLTCC
jgi:hypothetical protein